LPKFSATPRTAAIIANLAMGVSAVAPILALLKRSASMTFLTANKQNKS
jgi:hypothetical protein